MTFKDFARQDIKNVFLNENEFAEHHTIDGEQFLCSLITRGFVQSSGEQLGVYVQKKTIIIDKSDIENEPVEGQRLNVDGSYLYVDAVDEKDGMLNIVLSANRGV